MGARGCSGRPCLKVRPGARQCLVVNLCFVTAMARSLGLEGHVCEVQIVPRAFAALVVRARGPGLATAVDACGGAGRLRWRCFQGLFSVDDHGGVGQGLLSGPRHGIAALPRSSASTGRSLQVLALQEPALIFRSPATWLRTDRSDGGGSASLRANRAAGAGARDLVGVVFKCYCCCCCCCCCCGGGGGGAGRGQPRALPPAPLHPWHGGAGSGAPPTASRR